MMRALMNKTSNLPLSTLFSFAARATLNSALRAQFENTLARISSSLPPSRSGAIASRALEPRLAASARRPLRLRGPRARSGVAARVVSRRSVRSRACAMGPPRVSSRRLRPAWLLACALWSCFFASAARAPELVLDASLPPDANAPALVYDEGRDAPLALTTGDLDVSGGVPLVRGVPGPAAIAFVKTDKDYRARNAVEFMSRMMLLTAACIAILTTVGIVLSLVFNTVEFLRLYPAWDFFFGTRWNGTSQLGLLPLLWGTLYISIIALIVAVPIGLFAAIYLSEYASKPVRAFAKPALEVLAGIPTIVYGLFALLTVGPFLLNVFGDGGALGVDWMSGATAVMTAGLVMGIMLVPFVSSLSDDIINAVPQAMRDGSLGLGATHSETVRQVILPAALPGIVGAILLAASRAIGETMIVVLGAGAAAKLSLNPFEAMTTVTAKIVSQLTGDADFASPEALVAFALGMTLFVITLGLNILALYIVRKYREQYE